MTRALEPFAFGITAGLAVVLAHNVCTGGALTPREAFEIRAAAPRLRAIRTVAEKIRAAQDAARDQKEAGAPAPCPACPFHHISTEGT